MVVTCFVLHNFCKERNIEPILADMDKVIVMERLNAPTKDIVYMCKMQAGGAIRDAIIRYFVEYLQDNGQTKLSTINMQLYELLQESDMNKSGRAQLLAKINVRLNNS